MYIKMHTHTHTYNRQEGLPRWYQCKESTCQETQETWIQSPGQGPCLEERNGNSPQYPCWEILWTEEPGGLQSMGSQSRTWLRTQDIYNLRTCMYIILYFTETFNILHFNILHQKPVKAIYQRTICDKKILRKVQMPTKRRLTKWTTHIFSGIYLLSEKAWGRKGSTAS